MNQQKVVVILLLITIILSIFSVIVSVASGQSDSKVVEKETITKGPAQQGSVSFQVVQPSTESGGSG